MSSSTTIIRFSPDTLLYPFGYDSYFEDSFPPSDTRTHIRSFAQRLDDEVAQIEVQRLQPVSSDIRTSLEWAQHHICRSLDYHCAVIAPARSLPAEMLTRIFRECLDRDMDVDRLGDGGDSYHLSSSNRGIPWNLTYVCRRWRHNATCTPSLWPRTIVVSASALRRARASNVKPLSLTQGDVSLLGLCLERSHPLPLKIKFQYLLNANTANDQRMFIIAASELFRHASRFRLLDLDVDPGDAIPNPFHSSATESLLFPQLRSLACSGTGGVPAWLVEALVTTPKLFSLSLQNAQIYQELAAPSAQLTRLAIGSPYGSSTVDLALRALSSMPNLEDCALYISSSDTEHSTKTLTLPRLKILSIESDGTVEEEFLDLLMLPSLQKVTLFSPDEPAGCIQGLIDRCHCTITSLGIMIEDSNVVDLTHLLRNISGLQELRILVGASLTALDVLLEVLVMKDKSYSLPCLEELLLEGLPMTTGNDAGSVGDDVISKIIEVIQSRLHPPSGRAALQLVSLRFFLIPDDDDTQALSMSDSLKSLTTPSREALSNLGVVCLRSVSKEGRCEIVVQVNNYWGSELDDVRYSFELKEWKSWYAAATVSTS